MSGAFAWTVVALQVASGAGIITFWISWFRSEHAESWLPAGFIEHERAFVVPDSVIALLLIGSAGLEVAGVAAAAALARIASGMLIFLGLIDLTYFVQNRLLSRERGGTGNLALVAFVCTLAALLIIYYR